VAIRRLGPLELELLELEPLELEPLELELLELELLVLELLVLGPLGPAQRSYQEPCQLPPARLTRLEIASSFLFLLKVSVYF
jgi:hypothetical protein